MAETDTTQKKADPGLLELQAMLSEFKQHKARLDARKGDVKKKLEAGELDSKELGALVVELFSEVHDTALSFQEDLVSLVLREWQAEGAGPGDEEDDDDEIDSFLLAGD